MRIIITTSSSNNILIIHNKEEDYHPLRRLLLFLVLHLVLRMPSRPLHIIIINIILIPSSSSSR